MHWLCSTVYDRIRWNSKSYSSEWLAPESDLSGSIPAELGNMAALTYLGLSCNNLSGEKRILQCTRSRMLLYAMESDCIPWQSKPLHLNLLCQGPFRRNWVTWPRSLICIYLVTVYQVRSVFYHAREVGCCCLQWSPIAFHSKATHFIWIFSVRVIIVNGWYFFFWWVIFLSSLFFFYL